MTGYCYIGRTDSGMVRENNEDAFVAARIPDTPLILQKQTLLRFFVSPVGNIGMSGNSLFTVSIIFLQTARLIL